MIKDKKFKALYNQWLSGGYIFSSRGQAVIDNATSRGFTQPTQQELRILDSQILRPMSSTLWGKVKVLRVFSYNDTAVSDFSRLNLKDPAAPPILVWNVNHLRLLVLIPALLQRSIKSFIMAL